MRSLLLLAALALSACDTTLDAKDYSQACTADSECVAVFVGQVCQSCGGCANAAINTKDKSRYDNDSVTLRKACIQVGPPVLCAAAACLEPRAACVNGACALKTAP